MRSENVFEKYSSVLDLLRNVNLLKSDFQMSINLRYTLSSELFI